MRFNRYFDYARGFSSVISSFVSGLESFAHKHRRPGVVAVDRPWATFTAGSGIAFTMSRFLLFFAVGLASAVAVVGADTFTYPDLVRRMTDLSLLAKLPAVGEKTSLASSYDRASRYDAATDKYIRWDANGDGKGIVRKEGDNDVLMDVQGPGCIWRTWSATALTGHVKIYLDGSDTPAVDLPLMGYFDGKTAPFNRPNLVYIPSVAAHGLDNYTPISFQKSCKIVGEKGWGNYYQFTYTQFPAGTVVPTFSMNLSAEDSAALDHADKILGACGQSPTTDVPERKIVTAEAGKTASVADLSGEGAITALKVKLDLPKDAEAQRILLRQLTISITYDGESAPAVWSPLGDFFGYVGGADRFRSLPVGLMEDGTFYCYWYMPYGKGAHIKVGNDGPSAVAMNWEITHSALTQPIASLARFHAKWHRDAFLTSRADRAPDWTLLTTQGQGRYVGTHLHGWNPRGLWWGEGDDKFFVDGEKFPSSFGTGSEDYFGYAWSSAGHFSRAYHNQILNENNSGHFDDNRFHIPDSVPFDTSFEGSIEKYFPNERSTLYAAEVFWYLNAGGTDPYTAVPVNDRVGYWVKPVIYHEPDVIEGETLRATTKPTQNLHSVEMWKYGKQWSNDHQLLWVAKANGDTVSLNLPTQKAGKYRFIARFTKSPEYGIFQIKLNGVDVGQPVDLYGTELKAANLVDLGIVTLADGVPVLTVAVIGRNVASTGSAFGLDYLKLTAEPTGN